MGWSTVARYMMALSKRWDMMRLFIVSTLPFAQFLSKESTQLYNID